MSDVDAALERAENDPPADSWRAPMAQVVGDRTVLAAEVKRLRNLVIAQQAAGDQFMARIQHALKELEADGD